MSVPVERIQGSKTVADVERQANIAFERLEGKIGSGQNGASATTVAGLQAQIDELKNLSGGFQSIGGTGAGSPSPNQSDGTVETDGTTITGDGVNFAISLVVPVTLPDGGTGIIQGATQQITTNGTLIAAGTAQAQPALTLAGVMTTSAAMWSLPNVPDATWQTGIFMILVCTADTVTPYLVNPTAAGITPIAQLVNIKVVL